MAWSNAWDETAPSGSALRSTLDDIIRGLKGDIRQRMNTILDPSTPWEGTTDPLLLLPSATPVTRTVLLSCHGLQPSQDDDDISYANQFVESDNAGNNDMRMSLPFATGMTINSVEILFDLFTDTQATVSLVKHTFATTVTSTVVASEVITATGLDTIVIFLGSEVVTGGQYYTLMIEGNDAGRWHAYCVRFTYTETL